MTDTKKGNEQALESPGSKQSALAHARNLNAQGLKLAEVLKPHSTPEQHEQALSLLKQLDELIAEIEANDVTETA